jgi:hypothetical protein
MTKSFMLLFSLFFCLNSHAIVAPNRAPTPKFEPLQFNHNDIEKITGKKLTLFLKLKLKLAQTILKKYTEGELTATQKKQANASAILGISSMLLLLLAPTPLALLALMAIPAALMAVILGTKSRKGNSNVKGLFGAVTGAITLSVVVIFCVLIVLMYTGGGIE